MKRFMITSALIFGFFATSIAANDTRDGRNKKSNFSASQELRQLFKSEAQGKTGNASALVHFDENGCAEVLEMSANTPEMERLVAEKLQQKPFTHLKNNTIRLVVELRK